MNSNPHNRNRDDQHRGQQRSGGSSRGRGPSNGPSSRWLAFLAVQAYAQNGSFVSKTLDDLFTQFPTLPRERHFATEVAAETVRRGLTIDTILSRYVTRPRESVEDELWLLLQIGCCQLLFLPHVPPHAAVHETVALCERLNKPRAKGFINGTLRSLEREASLLSDETDTATQTTGFLLKDLDQHLLPIYEIRGKNAGCRTIEMAREVFADPAVEPIEYISQVTSLPHWLVARWSKTLPDLDQLLARCLWYTTPGRVSLRVNLNRTTREQVLNILNEAGVKAQPGNLPESIQLAGSISPGDISVFHDGWFSVQDESAMAATNLLAPRRGDTILDLCAAPGGKSCHIGERLHSTGHVIACDLSDVRLRPIRENIARLHLDNVEAVRIAEDGHNIPAGPFDAALVDAPCSNTGVLGKRPEARWRITPATIQDLIPLQRRLLNDAIDRVNPRGRVVYSTCSIDAAENSELVHSVVNSRTDVRLITEQFHEPGSPGDGGYQALLVKKLPLPEKV